MQTQTHIKSALVSGLDLEYLSDFSDSELHRVRDYTGSGFHDLNINLRAKKPLSHYSQELHEHMQEVLTTHHEPITIWRGVSLPTGIRSFHTDEWVEPAWVSTTRCLDMGKKKCGFHCSNKDDTEKFNLLEITIDPYVPFIPMLDIIILGRKDGKKGAFEEEQEIVLPPNLKMVVTDRTKIINDHGATINHIMIHVPAQDLDDIDR